MPSDELNDREQEALAYFFYLLWAVVVLNPRHQLRWFMKSMGLVKPHGPLKLSRAGERIITFCKAEGRPKYKVKK